MKRLAILFLLLVLTSAGYAQQKSFETLWKQVELLELQGKQKSALEVVNGIAEKAIAEKHEVQRIKTLLFQSKFALTLEEDAQLKIVSEFKELATSSATPTRNVVENMLARIYWDYFQNKRFYIYQRTKTDSKVDPDDFRTWDTET